MAAGVRFGCVLADAGYGLSAPFRHRLTARGLAWAVSIPGRQKIYPADVKLISPRLARGRISTKMPARQLATFGEAAPKARKRQHRRKFWPGWVGIVTDYRMAATMTGATFRAEKLGPGERPSRRGILPGLIQINNAAFKERDFPA